MQSDNKIKLFAHYLSDSLILNRAKYYYYFVSVSDNTCYLKMHLKNNTAKIITILSVSYSDSDNKFHLSIDTDLDAEILNDISYLVYAVQKAEDKVKDNKISASFAEFINLGGTVEVTVDNIRSNVYKYNCDSVLKSENKNNPIDSAASVERLIEQSKLPVSEILNSSSNVYYTVYISDKDGKRNILITNVDAEDANEAICEYISNHEK